MLAQTQNRIKARIIRALHTRLLEWYSLHRRDLPWRRTRDPYAILVSEIMLQQTRVAAVVPYYERWMRSLPTVVSLAKAKPDRVLALWAGLGYYSRARNLQKAAQMIVREFHGRVPSQVAALQSLPGVGRYTAGAITSIAFNQPAPILDGNVIRVLSRLFLVRGDTSTRRVRDVLWSLAGETIPAGDARDFNQALMELGALVCLPDSPQCDRCPMAGVCRAHHTGMADRVPLLRKRKPAQPVTQYALILRRGNKLLLRQRNNGELMEGMWSFPRFDSQRELRNYHPRVQPAPLGVVTHSVMNQRITVKAMLARSNHAPATPGSRWFSVFALQHIALPAADRRLAALAVAALRDLHSRRWNT
jgi:A/G-specific adenine glycosylase